MRQQTNAEAGGPARVRRRLPRKRLQGVALALIAFGVGMTVEPDPAEWSADHAFVTVSEARIGRPITPLSYAGVARRTTRRAVTPGVGYGGVGGPASGVGVLPGAEASCVGVGRNRGGPVNRVGRW